MQQPQALALEIMELRAYAAAKALVERSDTKEADLPQHPMIDMYWAIKADMVKARARNG